jgi:hypothetical protein
MHVKEIQKPRKEKKEKRKKKKKGGGGKLRLFHTNEPSATLTHIATCITGYSVRTQVGV